MPSKPTIQSINKGVSLAFKDIKEEIASLKRSSQKFSNELVSLNVDQKALTKQKAEDSVVLGLKHEVEKLRRQEKKLDQLNESVEELKSLGVTHKDFSHEQKRIEKEFKKLSSEIREVKKIKDAVNASRIADLEKSQVTLAELKAAVLEDVKRDFFTADELSKELLGLRKEHSEMQLKVAKIRKDIVDFPRTRIIANLVLFLAFVSLAGSAIALWLVYLQAANFLALEGVILLFIGVFIHLCIALAK